ncbi:DinB family protein [Catenuloplanes japonicus]|uniref:DinB family protein n=1 Tax=Catenuloplanes japonicus TaxID=33876 RepID=UPI00052417E6|nr:DinB family protein [Catenuloplanes japonicus]
MTDFSNRDMSGTRFRMVRLARSTFRDVDFFGSVMRGVYLVDTDINGEISNLTINGVDVAPLIEAELDRRDPRRALMRPTTPEGFVTAWETVTEMWEPTVARARTLDPELLHERVDDEWSFIETLRHLLFATDAWILRGVQGSAAPWHPLDLPWDGMEPTPGVPWDREARPSLPEVLELRRDRMATVRAVIGTLTPESLAASTPPGVGPGWPSEGDSYPVSDCLLTVLNEEWCHRLYAERDLDALETRGRPAA